MGTRFHSKDGLAPQLIASACISLLLLLSPTCGAGKSDANGGDKNPKAITVQKQVENQAQMTLGAPSKPSSEDYVIGPEDMLTINVWKEPEISRSVPVRPDGKISLPLLGDLTASGLTTVELRENITGKLKQYVSNPEVIVIVQEVKSRSFNIVGKVGRSGSYTLGKPMTVLDAIAGAGGFLDFAKRDKIYVLRPGANGSPRMLRFNYNLVIKGRRLDQNVNVQSGDTIVVP